MFVYLKCGDSVIKVPDVTLQDCYKPVIGEFIEERVDAALWYKVLVLQAVFVDCDQQRVFWTVDDNEEALQFFKRSEQSVSHGDVVAFFQKTERLLVEDCYDFDPNIDELFDTARKVLDIWDRDALNSHDNLLKMLHVYILPKVQFSAKHSDQIREVLLLIEVQHEKIEDKIQKKDMTKKNTEISLRKQRERILKNEDFSRTTYIASLSEKFLKVFLQHLEKDIRKMNEEFISNGSEVEQLRDSKGRKEMDKLNDRRVRRDSIYDDLQKAIAAREEIKNVIVRNHGKKAGKKSKRRSCHTVFHEVYMEVAARQQGMSKEIQNLINIKIKMSSVREAVLLSVRELEVEGETFGYNRKKGTFEIETDLYDPHNKPEEWSTLEEKVKCFLKAKQLGVRSKFEKFCTTIKDKCQRLFDDTKLFTLSLSETPEQILPPISPKTADTLNLLGASSQNRRSTYIDTSNARLENAYKSSRRTFAKTYTSRWSFGTIPKESCENICHDMIEHVTQIATELAVEIKQGQNEIPRSFICKVYICYEEHVSSKLMPSLNELYEHSYKEKCDSLSKWIERTPMSEFGFGEHIISNFLHVVPSESSSEASSREASSDLDEAGIEDVVINHPKSEFSKSLSNKSVKDMTLEQLYNYCDSQTDALPPMYHGMMDNDADMNGAGNSDDNIDAEHETHLKEVYDGNETIEKKSVEAGLEIGEECDQESFIVIPDSAVNSREFDVATSNYKIPLKETAIEEVKLRPKSSKSSSTQKQYSAMPLTIKEFCKQFKDFEKILKDEDVACTLFRKLRVLTQALKYIETQISEFRKGTGSAVQVCSDDLLDIIIMLLCNIQPSSLLKLYSHMNLLMHLRPNFMEGSAHDYALITFCGAFQHLFEQKMLSNNSAQC